MELFSMAFFIFVVVFVLLHEAIGKLKNEYQWIVRLIASISFYTIIAGLRIIFLAVSVISVWITARILMKITEEGRVLRTDKGLSRDEKKAIRNKVQKRKRLVLFLALAVNVGILILVKYIMPLTSKSIVLPLGISFYTFMAVSYLVDVYGEKYEAEQSLAKIALYLSWFPQMLQGPINRFDFVKDTLFGSYRLKYEDFKSSAMLFAFGAIKKYALANVLAPCVNEVFLRDNLSDLPGSILFFTAFLFAIEQYADFSGGIDMVMAISGLFGVKMNENFRQPYFAKSISEFWRRWHISLGKFLRDYVFYPFALLPGMMKLNDKVSKRFSKHAGRSLVAGLGNLLVFLLVGLWHGSALHYVVWGLYNGIIIVVSDFLSPQFAKLKEILHIKKESKLFAAFQILRTFLIIVLAGYFDAVSDVSNGLICFRKTFTDFRLSELSGGIRYFYDCGLISDIGILVAVLSLTVVIINSICAEKKKNLIEIISGKFIVIRWVVYLFMFYLVMFGFAASTGNGGFMYAAF